MSVRRHLRLVPETGRACISWCAEHVGGRCTSTVPVAGGEIHLARTESGEVTLSVCVDQVDLNRAFDLAAEISLLAVERKTA